MELSSDEENAERGVGGDGAGMDGPGVASAYMFIDEGAASMLGHPHHSKISGPKETTRLRSAPVTVRTPPV